MIHRNLRLERLLIDFGITGFGSLPTAANLGWHLMGMGDFDGDGRVDLLWRNLNSGKNTAWLLNGLQVKGFQALTAVTGLDWIIEN
jgi:hypothetical protein